MYFPVEVKAKVRILCPLQKVIYSPPYRAPSTRTRLGGTTEKENYMQLLRAALELLGQLAQSLVFWQSFQQASITLPIRKEGGPVCSKENEQELKH